MLSSAMSLMADTNKDRSEVLRAADAPAADEPMLFCPRCNSRLTPHKCKLQCGLCGYYMSCADYY